MREDVAKRHLSFLDSISPAERNLFPSLPVSYNILYTCIYVHTRLLCDVGMCTCSCVWLFSFFLSLFLSFFFFLFLSLFLSFFHSFLFPFLWFAHCHVLYNYVSDCSIHIIRHSGSPKTFVIPFIHFPAHFAKDGDKKSKWWSFYKKYMYLLCQKNWSYA